MRRCLLGLLALLLLGCSEHDKGYDKTHPRALFEALSRCQEGNEGRCAQLRRMAEPLRELALSLKQDPFLFGQAILALEVRCGSKALSLQAHTKCVDELQARLVIVRWLESPEK